MNNDRKPNGKPLFLFCALFLVLFAILAGFVLSETLAELESVAYSWAAGLMTPAMTAFMRLVTRIIDPVFVIVFCVALLVLPRTRRTVALPVCAAAAVAFLVNLVLKHIFARERPDILRMVTETSPSFPSAHAMVSAAMYTVLILAAFHYLRSKPLKVVVTILLVCLTALIGFSRMYLGVHHAGDIIGGWLLGIPVAAVVFHIWRLLLERMKTE